MQVMICMLWFACMIFMIFIAIGSCQLSCILRCALTSSTQELLRQSWPNLVCSICRVRRQEIVNFMPPPPIPRGGNSGVISVKLMYFFKNIKKKRIKKRIYPLLYSRELFRQIKYILMMTKEGSTKFVNFMTPGAGVLVLERSHMSYSENALFL